MELTNYHFVLTTADSQDPYDHWQITGVDGLSQTLGYLVFAGLRYNYCLEIKDLYVNAAYRRQGIGRALLKQLVQAYPATPIFTRILPVYRSTNYETLTLFYRKNGFVTKDLTMDEGEGYFGF